MLRTPGTTFSGCSHGNTQASPLLPAQSQRPGKILASRSDAGTLPSGLLKKKPHHHSDPRDGLLPGPLVVFNLEPTPPHFLSNILYVQAMQQIDFQGVCVKSPSPRQRDIKQISSKFDQNITRKYMYKGYDFNKMIPFSSTASCLTPKQTETSRHKDSD